MRRRSGAAGDTPADSWDRLATATVSGAVEQLKVSHPVLHLRGSYRCLCVDNVSTTVYVHVHTP